MNEARVVSHRLSHGDNISIGKHVLLFVGEKGKAEAEELEKKMSLNKTMMLDTAKQRELLSKQKSSGPCGKAP